MHNLSLNISTRNGTGSLSANQLLTRMLFRSGWELGAYNFFPSNIAGLPCLYQIRLNSRSRTAFDSPVDVLLALNPNTFEEHAQDLKKGGILITDDIGKWELQGFPPHQHWKIPISQTVQNLQELSVGERGARRLSPKQKVLLKNMVYVAFLCRCLKVETSIIHKSLEDFFGPQKNPSRDSSRDFLREYNFKIFEDLGDWANSYSFPILDKKFFAKKSAGDSAKKDILIDGNTSSALGALCAGCQFVSWYPITPATSLVENFEKLAHTYQKDSEGKNKVIVLQAEDELASISQVIGAGWAGLRAMTATSGPGLSLMAEGAGLSYFAEVPAVICHVQRAGPSTGLPTRTQQSDLLSACFLSHGDSKHIVLMPGNPEEAFQWTALAFDLAEILQTLVIVLSDLDLGMNLRRSPRFVFPDRKLQRGKVLKAEDFATGDLASRDFATEDFLPYKDEDKDGISYRSLPGIRHPKGAYLTRGSGHNIRAEYSEKAQDYRDKLDKLARKWETAKKHVPPSVIEHKKGLGLAFITFGPNQTAIKEIRDFLLEKQILSNYLRVCSFPFPSDLEPFLQAHKQIFVVEQNRDGQLKQLLSAEYPQQSHKMQSLTQYDGRPLMVSHLKQQLKAFIAWD